MRYLLAITENEDAYEGLLLTETGIVLKRQIQSEGSALFRSLLADFPVRKAAVCLSGRPFMLEAPSTWRIRKESLGEAMIRSAYGEEDGAVLVFGKRMHIAVKKRETVREITDIPFGSAYMAEEAIRLGVTEESVWLRLALEETASVPKGEISEFLKKQQKENPAKLAGLIRRGAFSGDMACLALVKRALCAINNALFELKATPDMPFKAFGLLREDMPVIHKGLETFWGTEISLEESKMPPVFGSVRGAVAVYKKPSDVNFHRRFSETYFLY